MPGCQYWDCGRAIRPDHFLCNEHFADSKDGLIDRCPKCNRFKDSDYFLCLECYRDATGSRVPAPRPPSTSRPREYSPAWKRGDTTAEEFYVYLLKIDGAPEFYAGQTRDLRARLWEHRENKAPSTARKKPRLVWFDSVPSRDEATSVEARLKGLIEKNPREVRKLIIRFRDLVKELDKELDVVDVP